MFIELILKNLFIHKMDIINPINATNMLVKLANVINGEIDSLIAIIENSLLCKSKYS